MDDIRPNYIQSLALESELQLMINHNKPVDQHDLGFSCHTSHDLSLLVPSILLGLVLKSGRSRLEHGSSVIVLSRHDDLVLDRSVFIVDDIVHG